MQNKIPKRKDYRGIKHYIMKIFSFLPPRKMGTKKQPNEFITIFLDYYYYTRIKMMITYMNNKTERCWKKKVFDSMVIFHVKDLNLSFTLCLYSGRVKTFFFFTQWWASP